jgi:nicotinamidase-related amidase
MPTLSLDPRTTALVVIDLQQGIVGMPTEPRPATEVVSNAVKLTEAARSKSAFVVLVRVAFSPDGADALRPDCDSPTPATTPRPADWSTIVPALAAYADHVITKRQWGAFYGTDLDLQLRRRGVSTIVLCGIATCFGVESTARQAYELGYSQVFVEDAMSSRSAAEHEHTVTRVFPRIGRVRSVAEVIAALALGVGKGNQVEARSIGSTPTGVPR